MKVMQYQRSICESWVPVHPTDDEEDEEDGEAGDGTREKRDRKASDDEESVFHRLEQSRQMLEQELGIDRFLRVYKFLQVIVTLPVSVVQPSNKFVGCFRQQSFQKQP